MGKEGEGGRERKNPNTIIVSRKFYPGDELRHPPVCTYPRFPSIPPCSEKKNTAEKCTLKIKSRGKTSVVPLSAFS